MNKQNDYRRFWILGMCTALTVTLASCDYRSERNGKEQSVEAEAAQEKNPDSPHKAVSYAVFLENSGSMDGYVRGVTSFEDDIYKLLVDISYLADTVKVNYINTQVIPYKAGIQSFINNLEPSTFQQRGGNRSSSNINQIFQHVLQEVNNQEVSVLISDYIFSVESGNTEDKLNNQKISIYNTFRRKLQQEPFATLIIKLQSEFNGNYYDKNDRPVYLKGVKRPYYIWLMGNPEAISNFRNQIRFNTLEGFEYTYMLTASAEEPPPFFTVMNNYNKTGNFRTDRAYSGSDYVHGVRNVEAASRGEAEGQFGFSIALDMRNIPVDQEYLTNPDNYQVNEAYTLEDIQPLEEIPNMPSRDLAVVAGKATHVLTFVAQGKAYPDLHVRLKKQTPAWVEATQTVDDTKIKSDSTQQEKTFGLGYLVKGVEEAYQYAFGSNTYFSIEVSIKK